MTKEDANAVYDVLVRECGARDEPGLPWWRNPRDSFVGAVIGTRPVHEYRFQGALGFGGKFYLGDRHEPHRVGCYSEDETPERLAMIERANAALMGIAR